VLQPISRARCDSDCSAEDGFTLVEMLCVITILALLAAVAIPAWPRTTSRARLESYAIATAALLKADRNAALRRNSEVATQVSAKSRMVRSGANGRVVRVPDDVDFDALLSARCAGGSGISFFPSGMSCGGVIALTRQAAGYEVRVNWLTGGIEVVPLNRT